jgi:hypothetical protein
MTLQSPQPIKPLGRITTKPRNEMSFCTEDELLLKFLYLCWDKDKQKKKSIIGAVGKAK